MVGSNEPCGGRDFSITKLDRLTVQVSILDGVVIMLVWIMVMIPFLKLIITTITIITITKLDRLTVQVSILDGIMRMSHICPF